MEGLFNDLRRFFLLRLRLGRTYVLKERLQRIFYANQRPTLSPDWPEGPRLVGERQGAGFPQRNGWWIDIAPVARQGDRNIMSIFCEGVG